MTLSILHLGGGYLVPALRELGHRVLHVGPIASADMTLNHPMTGVRLMALLAEQGFVPDVALYEDNGNLPQFIGLELFTCPSFFYSIDTFCNPWHVPFGNAFDRVFVAQKGHVELFTEQGMAASWLPLFCTQPVVLQTGAEWLERDIPVSFVGTLHPKNIPTRWPFLQRFKALHPLICMQGEYMPIFTRSRIVLNQTAASELNFRCFEALGCGTALLMETCPELCDVFTPGVNILPPYCRENAGQAAVLANTWLVRPERLAQVAFAGQELVRTQHTALARARTLCLAFDDSLAKNEFRSRLQEGERRSLLLSTAYAILMVELDKPEFAVHKALYQRLFCANIRVEDE